MRNQLTTIVMSGLLCPVMAQNLSINFEVGGGAVIDDEKRINVFIMSDGYTSQQEAEFLGRAQALTNELFGGSSTPFDIYGDYFNVYRIFVPSDDEGALHPCFGCSGSAEESCSTHVSISTAFGSSFDTPDPDGNGFHRLLCANPTLVNNYIESGPLSSHITGSNILFTTIVLVNTRNLPGLPITGEWGGCGNMDDEIATMTGEYSVVSYAMKAAVHEFGHSFAKLQDEYYYHNETEAPNKDEAVAPDTPDNWDPWVGTGGIDYHAHSNAPIPIKDGKVIETQAHKGK